MRIFIIAMDDPLYINKMLIEIIDKRKEDIVGFAYIKNSNRMTIKKNRSKKLYIISLFLIMGPVYFIKNVFITMLHKIKIVLSKNISFIKSPLVVDYAVRNNIESYTLKSPNNGAFIKELIKKEPDIIINQSMSILKSKLLSIPKIGTLNRHNALLPKNRGRLTPFWVLYKNEKKTGVSIHFVEEGIDSGDIVIQEEFPVTKKDTFNSLVKKNYKIAGKAMLKALALIDSGNAKLITNEDKIATYNTTPSIKQAWKYRNKRLFSLR